MAEKIVNGINVSVLGDSIETIKKDNELAKFKFRVSNNWIEGTNNRAKVKGSVGEMRAPKTRAAAAAAATPPASPSTVFPGLRRGQSRRRPASFPQSWA